MIAKVVSGGGGSGASGLADYMDDRGRDETVDELRGLGLFSRVGDEDLDGLEVREANVYLAREQAEAPEKDDLIHLVVGLTDKEFEALGDTNVERREAFREAVREGMAELERELGVEDLRYVAAIHLDTDNPHSHIAIQKTAFDRETGGMTRVERIPGDLLPPAQSGRAAGAGERGRTLIDMFEEARRAHEAPVRLVQFQPHANSRAEVRAIVDARERQPTDAERLVGRWVLSVVAPEKGTDPSALREKLALRHYVAQLDAEASRAGRPLTAAFIERDQLRDLIAREKVTPLDEHGAAREPYMREREGPVRGPAGPPERSERSPADVLGRELTLRLTAEHLRWKLDLAERLRDTRRVTIPDIAHGGRMREMSAHDIQARAQAVASRETAERAPATTAERETIRAAEMQAAIDPHRPALDTIEQKHKGYVAHLAKELDSVRDELRTLTPEARDARAALRSAGVEPRPALDPKELGRLQEEAIARGDVKAVRQLEALRAPGSRSPEDARRLVALATVARTETRVAERRLDDFERSRHLRKYGIGGQQHSLASVDRLQRAVEKERAYYQTRADAVAARLDRAKTWTRHGVMTVWKREDMEKRGDTFRAKAAALDKTIEGYQAVREKVVARIGDDRKELGGQALRARELSETLGQIEDGERARASKAGAPPLEGRFTERELRRLEDNALVLRDPALLAVVDKARAEDPHIRPEDRAARMEGRAIAAAVESKAAQEYARSHLERSAAMPVLYQDSAGADRTAAPRDVEPKGWWGRITGGAFDSREERSRRSSVRAAAFESAESLTRDSQRLAQFAGAARAAVVGEAYIAKAEGREVQKPLFTAREAMRIEAFAEGTRDPESRSELRTLIAGAIEEGRVRNLDEPRGVPRAVPERMPEARDRAASAPGRADPASTRHPGDPTQPHRREDTFTPPARPLAPPRPDDREQSRDYGRGR